MCLPLLQLTVSEVAGNFPAVVGGTIAVLLFNYQILTASKMDAAFMQTRFIDCTGTSTTIAAVSWCIRLSSAPCRVKAQTSKLPREKTLAVLRWVYM